ncbi:MAG: hypothetical protein ACOC0N_06650 [Chroococcales cyanobacterium]
MRVQTTQVQPSATPKKNHYASQVEARFQRLESIIEQIGETVLATSETVERLAKRVDVLAVQVQHQGNQVQQQGYQIFALTDAVERLATSHIESKAQLTQLTKSLQQLVTVIEATHSP